jgi:protein O-mannosyl-transferase
MSRAKTLSKAQVRRRLQPKMPPGKGPFLTGKNLKIILSVLLGVATIALYSPVIGYPFTVYDDSEYVVENTHIRGGLAWSTIKWAFTSTAAANWHPLTWLSHAFDYQLFALNPAGHHFDSVLIHASNAVLLFLLLAWVTNRVGPGLLVTALFAVHPLNVESVAWVAERKNVLSTLFFLLAIGAYVWYTQKPQWRRYLLVAALFAAGLMAKPMVITLPFVLLLLDYWPLERMPPYENENGSPPATAHGVLWLTFSGRLLLEKIPLFVLSAASAWITLKAQRTGSAVRTLQQSPLPLRIENAVVSYSLYLWKMLWPGRLAAHYPYPEHMLPVWEVLLSALMLLVVTALAAVFRRKRYLPVGWLWFLVTLIPVIGLIRVGAAAMADRYAYIPLIGIFIIIAWGLDDWAEAKAVRAVWRVIPALCVLTALGFATSRQMSYWDNDYDLWSRALEVNEQNPLAHDALASILVHSGVDAVLNQRGLDTKQKQIEEARRHFERALELRRQLTKQNPAYLPDMATTLSNLGNLELVENRIEESRQHYEESLEIDRQLARQSPNSYLTDMAGTLRSLGYLDLMENRLGEARQNSEEALKIDRQLAQQSEVNLPNLAATLYIAALVNERQNRVEEARAHFTEAMTIYRRLAQGDQARYAGAAARVEASLEELGEKALSR